MGRQESILVLTALAPLLLLGFGSWQAAHAAGKKMTITGEVYDSGCLFTKNLTKPISQECALECAAGGSPLVIKGKDGYVYLPVDDKMPAQGQNYRLIKFGARTVKVTGMVYEQGSARAIVIESIEEIKPAAK
jgi:hypothetical protein